MKCVALIVAVFPAVLLGAERWTIATRLEVARIPEAIVLPAMARLIDPLTAQDAWRALQKEHAAAIQEVASVTAFGIDQEECQAFEGEDVADRSHYKVPDPKLRPATSPDPNDPGTFYPSTSVYRLEFGTRLECFGEVFPESGLIRISYKATQSEPVGPVRFEGGLLPSGLKLLFEKLEDTSRTVEGRIIVRPGESRVISVAKVQSQPATLELMFLTATCKPAQDTAPPPHRPLVDSGLPAAAAPHAAKLPTWQVPLDSIRIRVNAATAMLLRRHAENGADGASLREALALVAKGKAELVDWQIIADAASKQCRAANTRLRIKYRRSEPSDSHPPVTFGSGAVASIQKEPETLPANVTPPDVFESEDEGTTFEAAAEVTEHSAGIGPPKAVAAPLVSVYYSSGVVEFRHFRRWPVGPNETGVSSVVFGPEFDRRKVASNVMLVGDLPMLISFARLPKPDQRFELTWIRASPRKALAPAHLPNTR